MQNELKPQSSWKPPSIRTPAFKVLTEEEAAAIRGGGSHTGWGVCALVGISCDSNGGFGFGLCPVKGVSTRKMDDPPGSAGATKLGLCVAVGYACWARGGFHWGLCAVVGATTEPQ